MLPPCPSQGHAEPFGQQVSAKEEEAVEEEEEAVDEEEVAVAVEVEKKRSL